MTQDAGIGTWAEVTRAYEEVRGSLERVSRDVAGIPLPWVEVLLRLDGSPGQRVRMTDLACSVGFSDSGASRLVDRMEDAGYVTRELCRTDRRGTEAVLTPAGRTAFRTAMKHLAPAVAEELAPLSPAELDTLRDLMSRLGSTSALRAD